MDESTARLRALKRNIDRFQKLPRSNLSSAELRFVEQRLSEDQLILAKLQSGGHGSALDTTSAWQGVKAVSDLTEETLASSLIGKASPSQRVFCVCFLATITVATFGWWSALGWLTVKATVWLLT
ncbi:hypothetical protein [Bradyrhizobium erythrophlei]|uniref:Uncharacterized protein n=1 Tax=Bradyrhizobium erythrophlei TaxID=1437360 RepID=A0A1M7SQR6_9BRAD|nr:hypothetical protein [Bradyrhizobium erythrophlei]SHN60877.1 hypothetical protein SAMN05444170_0049 [Bradyrhizobium erythrophlei]